MPYKPYTYKQSIFINCPFDIDYSQLFDAMLFTIIACSYYPRCALELNNGGQARIEKIQNIIAECQYGIHDLSRTELDEENKLPRFNIPLELGLFLGAKRYGNNQQQKKCCLILDKIAYRYQKFISDISGQDIEAHHNNIAKLILVIRNWLRNCALQKPLPTGNKIYNSYLNFMHDCPEICAKITDKKHYSSIRPELQYNDFVDAINAWLLQS